MKNLKLLRIAIVIFVVIAFVCPVSVVVADSWVSPTGFNDPDTAWWNEPLAYDGNITSGAICNAHGQNTWSSFLELTTERIYCSHVRYYDHLGGVGLAAYNKIDIDVYYDLAWHDLYEGAYSSGVVGFVELELPESQYVTAMRVRYYSTQAPLPASEYAYEFGFYQEYTTAETILRGLIPGISATGIVLALLAVIGKGNPHALLYAGAVGGVVFISVMALVNSVL